MKDYWTGLEDDKSVVEGLVARDVTFFKWMLLLKDIKENC